MSGTHCARCSSNEDQDLCKLDNPSLCGEESECAVRCPTCEIDLEILSNQPESWNNHVINTCADEYCSTGTCYVNITNCGVIAGCQGDQNADVLFPFTELSELESFLDSNSSEFNTLREECYITPHSCLQCDSISVSDYCLADHTLAACQIVECMRGVTQCYSSYTQDTCTMSSGCQPNVALSCTGPDCYTVCDYQNCYPPDDICLAGAPCSPPVLCPTCVIPISNLTSPDNIPAECGAVECSRTTTQCVARTVECEVQAGCLGSDNTIGDGAESLYLEYSGLVEELVEYLGNNNGKVESLRKQCNSSTKSSYSTLLVILLMVVTQLLTT